MKPKPCVDGGVPDCMRVLTWLELHPSSRWTPRGAGACRSAAGRCLGACRRSELPVPPASPRLGGVEPLDGALAPLRGIAPDRLSSPLRAGHGCPRPSSPGVRLVRVASGTLAGSHAGGAVCNMGARGARAGGRRREIRVAARLPLPAWPWRRVERQRIAVLPACCYCCCSCTPQPGAAAALVPRVSPSTGRRSAVCVCYSAAAWGHRPAPLRATARRIQAPTWKQHPAHPSPQMRPWRRDSLSAPRCSPRADVARDSLRSVRAGRAQACEQRSSCA